MKKSFLGVCLTITTLLSSQASALTLISDAIEKPAVLQANPQLNDPEIMAIQQQFSQCWETAYIDLSQHYTDAIVVQHESAIEQAMEDHQRAVLTEAPTKNTLYNLVNAFEQLGVYLLDKRGATPEIATQYCSIVLVICSTVATMQLSAQLSVDLQEPNGPVQRRMQEAGMELSRRLETMFIESFGFTFPTE